MADPELRTRMGRAGRERVVQHFSWRSIAEQTKALYEEVAAKVPVEPREPAAVS